MYGTKESDDTVEAEITGILARPIFPGPGPGRLGVVAARAGVGKSVCLVRLALGEMLRDRQVLHVSLDKPVSVIRASYDVMLDAIQARGPTPASLRVEVERRRVIHSFLRGSFSPAKLDEALGFLTEHADFHPSMIVLDGFSFEKATIDDLGALGRIAARSEAELWMSARTHRDEPRVEESGLPLQLERVAAQLSVVVSLEPLGEQISVNLIKQGDQLGHERLPVMLDPATMLLVHDLSAARTR